MKCMIVVLAVASLAWLSLKPILHTSTPPMPTPTTTPMPTMPLAMLGPSFLVTVINMSTDSTREKLRLTHNLSLLQELPHMLMMDLSQDPLPQLLEILSPLLMVTDQLLLKDSPRTLMKMVLLTQLPQLPQLLLLLQSLLLPQLLLLLQQLLPQLFKLPQLLLLSMLLQLLLLHLFKLLLQFKLPQLPHPLQSTLPSSTTSSTLPHLSKQLPQLLLCPMPQLSSLLWRLQPLLPMRSMLLLWYTMFPLLLLLQDTMSLSHLSSFNDVPKLLL